MPPACGLRLLFFDAAADYRLRFAAATMLSRFFAPAVYAAAMPRRYALLILFAASLMMLVACRRYATVFSRYFAFFALSRHVRHTLSLIRCHDAFDVAATLMRRFAADCRAAFDGLAADAMITMMLPPPMLRANASDDDAFTLFADTPLMLMPDDVIFAGYAAAARYAIYRYAIAAFCAFAITYAATMRR